MPGLQEVGIVPLGIDTEKMVKELNTIDEKRAEVDKAVEKTKKKTNETWMLAVGVAQSSWTLFDALISAAGGTVSGVLRATISGMFSAIAIIKPLLAAEAVTPGMQFAAAFGFMQIALAIAAAQKAEQTASNISSKISATKSVLGDVNSFIGSFNFK